MCYEILASELIFVTGLFDIASFHIKLLPYILVVQ